MEKRFKVVAKSTIMDAEMNVRTMSEARDIFEKFRNSGSYNEVYVMDNETGELFNTYNIDFEAGGVKVNEWFKVAGDL